LVNVVNLIELVRSASPWKLGKMELG